MDESRLLKTGTTTLGIVCKDGIILAADKKATLGGAIVSSKDMDKVVQINNSLAVTTAGLVSDIQLLMKIIKAQIKLEELRKNRSVKVKEAANMLSSLVYGNIRKMSMIAGVTGFLIGGKDDTGYYLYSLGADGSLTLSKKFEADGSGMVFALGVLDAEYKEGISIDDGIKLARKAIRSAMERDTASGAGFDVIAITKDGVKRVIRETLKEELVKRE